MIFYIESLYTMENDPAREKAMPRVVKHSHALLFPYGKMSIHRIDNAPMMSTR